jgi:hypothetical protein
MRFGPQESALEQGWLLSEMEQRFSYSLDELARRPGVALRYRGTYWSAIVGDLTAGRVVVVCSDATSSEDVVCRSSRLPRYATNHS